MIIPFSGTESGTLLKRITLQYQKIETYEDNFHLSRMWYAGCKGFITLEEKQIEIFSTKFCINGKEIYICSPKSWCHSSVGRATD
jgi:hypothetical protein